jgi:hypothetical protein
VIGSVHAEVDGRAVDADACREIARHVKAEIVRVIDGSDRFEPG